MGTGHFHSVLALAVRARDSCLTDRRELLLEGLSQSLMWMVVSLLGPFCLGTQAQKI